MEKSAKKSAQIWVDESMEKSVEKSMGKSMENLIEKLVEKSVENRWKSVSSFQPPEIDINLIVNQKVNLSLSIYIGKNLKI